MGTWGTQSEPSCRVEPTADACCAADQDCHQDGGDGTEVGREGGGQEAKSWQVLEASLLSSDVMLGSRAHARARAREILTCEVAPGCSDADELLPQDPSLAGAGA